MLLRVFAIVVLVTPGFAQTSRGAVAGTVTDSSGAVIVDAVVRLSHNETGVVRSTSTNGDGIYRFDAVELGVFDLQIKKPGFTTLVSRSVIVESNRTTTVDATLQVGANETRVEVNAAGEERLLKESPLRGGIFEAYEVSRLPLESRNPISLAATLPGVVSPSGSTTFGAGTLSSPLDTRFAINGQRPRGNNYLLDGTDNNDFSFTGAAQPFDIADAVQEVSVQTSNFGAEFGRAGGGLVNVITKSGTNAYHGTIFWQYASQAFNSLSNLDKVNGSSHPDFSENLYGFTVGGPIKKNKTFFFAALQQDRFRSPGQFAFVVPTADAVTNLRSLFPGNPRLDLYLSALGKLRGSSNPFPVALGIDPVSSTDRGTVTFATARWPYPSTRDDTQGVLRLDHSWSPSQQMSFRYLVDSETESPFQGTNLSPSFPGYFADGSIGDHNLLLSDTYSAGATLTNELRFSYAREAVDLPISSHALPSAQVIPAIQLPSPIAAPGLTGAVPQFEYANNWLLQETQSKLIGQHTFRYGFEFLWQSAKQLGAGFAGRGIIGYTASSGYSAFANFLDDFSGPSGTVRRNFGEPIYYPDSFRQSYFFQDTWRTKPSLTLSLGLRYENFTQPANSLRFPAFAGFDPSRFLVPNKVAPDNNNFGPAIGVVWSPSPRSDHLGKILGTQETVLRAGFQISYDALFTQLLSFVMGDSPNTVQINRVSPVGAGRGIPGWSSLLPVAAPSPSIGDGQLAVFDSNIRNPYTERWSLGLQRTLPQRVLLDLAYVGAESHRLFTRDDINSRQLDGFRLNPSFGPRVIRSSIGNAAYHALQLQVERRFAEGLHINSSYTWSRDLDSTSESLLVNANSGNQNLTSVPVSEGGLKLDRGLSDYNRSQRLVISYIWDIPGPRQGVGKRVLGDWSIAGITTFQSGTPYTVQNGFDRNNDGFANDRPDIGNPNAPLNTRAVIAPASGPGSCSTLYRNPDTGACVTPSQVHFIEGKGLPNTQTVGRNTLLTGGTNIWDATLNKRFTLWESKLLEFRWDVFNVFNHRQFVQVPSSDVVSSPPGQFLNLKFIDGGIRSMRFQVKFLF
ncbi:MAG TPA: carboxypeptidase regulatory-like domain-containing protein [Terriglobales bacterium]|nr:carboxypeptidase regulatory-like domain-containing protein [Terriglobales bacterium]